MSQAGAISSNGGGGLAETFVANTGSATPSSGEIDLLGGTLITTSAAGNTVNINAADNVVGSVVTDSGTATPATNSFSIVGGTGIDTSGSGSTVTVTMETPVIVANGGSGRASATAYAVICGGTTSTSAHQSIASVGSSGQVLTSNGAAALPTFQDAAAGGLTAPVTVTYRTVSSTDDLDPTDYFVAVDTTGGAFTLTLQQTGMSSNQIFVIKDIGGDCSTENLTIDTSGAATIDGGATFVINVDYGAINLLYDGTDFWVY
jgi:hypothetical protein